MYPPQPESVTKEGFENVWNASKGADRYRRGLYTFIQRTSPFAQYITFDLPDTTRACTRRGRSNSPLQALNLLNDPVFFEAAQSLATNILTYAKTDKAERLAYGFKLCLGRKPRPEESARLLKYLDQQIQIFGQEPERATELSTAKVKGCDAKEAAAWVSLSSVMLNLDEFITKE